MAFETPAVLFLTFNRPDATRAVLEVIRAARPARLYVACDGPRPGRTAEAARVAQVREVATATDWDCDVRTLFRDTNRGCRLAVSEALDWFFEHEESGIVLEDDCVVDGSFFGYAAELLDRYRDDERVMTISALHAHGAAHRPEESYFFSRYIHCWGWASWRRAWALYDRDMAQWPRLRQSGWLLARGHGSRAFRAYWTRIFDATHAGKIDTWDYQWLFSVWAQSGLAILPARNLVRNIGFGEGATHTTEPDGLMDSLEIEPLVLPLRHPPCMVEDVAADRWTDVHVYGISHVSRAKQALAARAARVPGVRGLVRALRTMTGGTRR